MSNFLVNAKTKILEFKRKHNLLVKSGVKEIVNKEIEQGNIAVGTKLYRHIISFDNTDNNEEIEILVISTKEDEVNNYDTLINVLDNAVLIKSISFLSSPPPELYICVGYDSFYTPEIAYIRGSVIAFTYLDINYLENYRDIVLPL